MYYEVIASGSDGNCVIYHSSIAVDMGVSYSKVRPLVHRLQLVLISHEHKDHLNIDTIRKVAAERPTLRFGVGTFLADQLAGVRNVDILHAGVLYNYGPFQVMPVKLYHDVQNFGFRIFKAGVRILHCTDTAHLNGIEAKNYDLYALEHSYDADTIDEIIAAKEAAGQYAYEKGAVNSHLSEQQARQFIFNNAGEKYEVLRLHESHREYSKI